MQQTSRNELKVWRQGTGTSRPPLRLLTSLRWFAALLVWGVHGLIIIVMMTLGPFRAFFKAGAVGVSFFFLLSGFVLAWSWRPAMSKRSFWRNRAARIMPLHVLAWGAALVYFAVVGLRTNRLGSGLSLVLVQSWVPKREIYYGANLVSWSLAVEAFFYLCFPFLVRRLAASRSRGTILAGAIAFSVGFPVASLSWHGPWVFWLVYVFPLVRLPEFVIGIILGLEMGKAFDEGRLSRWPRIPLGPSLALALGAVWAAGHTPQQVSLYAVTLVPFILVLVAAAQRDLSGPRSWLHNPFLVKLGEVSYAFYLVHLTVMGAIAHLLPRWNTYGAARLFGIWLLVFEASLALAVLVHVCVEKPLREALRARPRPRADISPVPRVDITPVPRRVPAPVPRIAVA